MTEPRASRYKWYILALVVATNILVAAMPGMALSVLSKEIAASLGLSLVQVGVVWGIGALPGTVTSLAAGVLGDRFGPRRVLVIFSLAAGLVGAARGLAGGFWALVGFVALAGALVPFVTMNGFKTTGQWFPPGQLGLANGLISMGMALGFLLGSLLSATVLSPLLGGWRGVLILYGGAGALMCIPWLLARPLPGGEGHAAHGGGPSMRTTIGRVARLGNIWKMGLALFCVGGCIQGFLGYLPLYLRSEGWAPAQADAALSTFHLTSMIFVLPFALWSDRLGSRKRLLLFAALMQVVGAGALGIAGGSLAWAAVFLAGFVRDAFMALFLTMVVETRGVGPAFAGTATGITMTIASLGYVITPPLGNSLAAWWPSAPFAFWSALALVGFGLIASVRHEGAGGAGGKIP